MSFWAGVVQATKDIEAKDQQEALAAERQSVRTEETAYRDRMAKIQQTQWEAANARAETELTWKGQDRLFTQLGALTVPDGSGVSPSKAGGSGGSQGSGKAPSITHSIARANSYGVSKDVLAPFLGQGMSRDALDEALNSYQSLVDAYDGKPGTPPTADEFFSSSEVLFTAGTEVTDEMVIAGAKRLGVKLTDQAGETGSTWGEAITAQLQKQAGNGFYSLSTPSTPSTLDFGEVNEITTAAMGEVESYLNQNVRILRKAIDAGDMSQAPALTAAEAALQKFEDKTDTMEAINLVGADVILPMLANAPQDALGGNNFGRFNEAIASRTYPNQASVLAAFKNGELSEDSWYVIDKTIYQVNPEGMKAAASGPLVQDGGQGNLGDEAGTLPGERGAPQGGGGGTAPPLDLTDMSNEQRFAAILEAGLGKDDPIIVNGEISYLTEATIAAANRVAPQANTAGRNMDADNLIGSNPEGRPMTIDQLRAETEGNLGVVGDGVSTVKDFVKSSIDTMSGRVDKGLAKGSPLTRSSLGLFGVELPERSSLLQGVTATAAAIFDKFGLKEQADQLYGNVLDIRTNQAEAQEVGLINQMLESSNLDEWFDGVVKSGWLSPKDVENNPELEESLAEVYNYVKLDADNLIGFTPEREGYTPTQMGATELNLPKVLESLALETRKAVEAELQALPEEVTRSEGYRPVQIGATELNLPKVLGSLSPETMALVESDLQKMAGDTNLERMEQSRLGRVGAESDRLSTESKSMPNGYTPTQMGATELNSPKVRSALDSVTAPYVEAKGEPLTSEEELAIGIEALIKGLTSNVMPQDELDSLVMELQDKFTAERVREALSLAMNQ